MVFKKCRVLLVGMLAAGLVLSFSACSSDQGSVTRSDPGVSSSQSDTSENYSSETEVDIWEVEESQIESGTESDTGEITLETYIDLYGTELEETFSSEDMSVEIDVDPDNENTLVYSFTYVDQMDNTDNAATDLLDEMMTASEDTFYAMADQLADQIGSQATIHIRYLNADGSLLGDYLYTSGFSANE